MSASIWEDHSLAITGYPIGIDRAERQGETYSDKAPGQPFLAVPFYAVGQALGLSSAKDFQVEENVSLWWLTMWSSTLPAMVLFGLAVLLSGYQNQPRSVTAAAMIVTGTVILPFSTVLFGHVLSAALLLGSFALLSLSERPRTFLAGMVGGLAVATEYTAAIGVLILVAWVGYRSVRSLPAFLAGGLPVGAALALYNAAAFGSPWTLSYQFNAFSGPTTEPSQITSMFAGPTLSSLVEFLFSGRGIFVATPIVVVAMAGLILLARERNSRPLAVLCLTMVGSFFLLSVLWGNPWGGESPGARYAIPALAFLTPGLPPMIRRLPVITTGTWTISFGTMALATLTDALAITRDDPTGLRFWLGYVANGEWVPNIFGVLADGFGNLVFAVLVTAFSLALMWALWARDEPTG